MLPLIGMAYSFLSGTSARIDVIRGAGMSPLPDQLLNCLSRGMSPSWATMPESWLVRGLATSGTAPDAIAAWSFWSCWAIGMPVYSTVMFGLAAWKRLISSCHTGVRSGPALVSQNVIVTGAALAVPALPALPALPFVPPPQATASIASMATAVPLSVDSGVLMRSSSSLGPRYDPCVLSALGCADDHRSRGDGCQRPLLILSARTAERV